MNEWFPESANQELIRAFCVYVARHPVFDLRQQSIGYELLFRSSWVNRLMPVGEFASRRVIDISVAYGLHTLVGAKVPFINCTGEVLIEGLGTLLPPSTVLQLEGSCHPAAELIEVCTRLHATGRRLSLHNGGKEWASYLHLFDYYKVGLTSAGMEIWRDYQKVKGLKKLRGIAERVDTVEDLKCAKSESFSFFQGGYFGEPLVLARDGLASVMNRLKFLDELRKPELDLDDIITRLKQEPSLAFRLLRLANSAMYATSEAIRSLRMAFLLVGEQQFRKLAVNALSTELFGCTPETHVAMLKKARFCELMATPCHLDQDVMYLFGLLSDALKLLGISPEAMQGVVKLPSEVLDALAGRDNLYYRTMCCFETYDRGDWVRFVASLDALGIAGDAVSGNYIAAQRWADDVFLRSR